MKKYDLHKRRYQIIKNWIFFMNLYNLKQYDYKVNNIDKLKKSVGIIFPPISFMERKVLPYKMLRTYTFYMDIIDKVKRKYEN